MSRPFALFLAAAALAILAASWFAFDRAEEKKLADAEAAPAPAAAAPTAAPAPEWAPAAPAASVAPAATPAAAPTVEEIAALAERDPAAAVRLAMGIRDEDERADALHECLPQWLRADPAAARAWLLEASPAFSPEALVRLARDTASVLPEFALTLTARLPFGLRGPLTKDVFESWAATDPESAAARARSLGNGARDPNEVSGAETSDREVAVAAVVRLWSERDPRAASRWALTLADAASRRAALDTSFASWAAKDPAAAAAGLQMLPALAPERTRLFDSVVTVWAGSDAAAALHWLQTLPRGAERTTAATTLLTTAAHQQPADAAGWALQLSAENSGSLVGKVVAAWAATDRAAALAWANALPPGTARDACLRELTP